MEWYEMSEEEKVKNVYSKFTIKDFWNWWSDGENKVMEVRIRDFNLIKETAKRFNIPMSPSGVYINNDKQLKNVIAFIRDRATVWFGIQPRKKNWNRWGSKSFGGRDVNVDEIAFLFIDIDRVDTKGSASSIDLKNANILADMVLDRLSTEGWNKSYIKICSGHGLQLLIKLDFSIKLPLMMFDDKLKVYLPNEEFDKMKLIIPRGVGNQILRFCNKIKNELGVIVDKNVFKLSVVGALPFTKNLKHHPFKWRGIIEMKDSKNKGFSDYILAKENDIKTYKKKRIFQSGKGLTRLDRIYPGRFADHKLVRFMLDNDLPEGMRNNYLWFQLKCLIRDSNIDLTSSEFRMIHKQLEKRHGILPTNLPDKKFKFDENIVNKFFIENRIPPIYTLWPAKTKKVSYLPEKLDWKNYLIVDGIIELDNNTDIVGDMERCKETFIKGNTVYNNDQLARFVKGCIKKYGEEKTKYYFDYLFKEYFSRDNK